MGNGRPPVTGEPPGHISAAKPTEQHISLPPLRGTLSKLTEPLPLLCRSSLSPEHSGNRGLILDRITPLIVLEPVYAANARRSCAGLLTTTSDDIT